MVLVSIWRNPSNNIFGVVSLWDCRFENLRLMMKLEKLHCAHKTVALRPPQREIYKYNND